MKICGIYFIGTPGGKLYVGSSHDVWRRWTKHLQMLRTGLHTNRQLQNAYNFHGEDALTFNVVETCARCELLDREQQYIDVLPKPLRINVCLSAGGTRGRVWTDSQRALQSKIAKNPTTETRHKMSIAKKGKTLSVEHRAKITAAQVGKVNRRNKSGYAGVCRSGAKWRVQVTHCRTARHIGSYATPELAYAMRLVYLAALPEGGM